MALLVGNDRPTFNINKCFVCDTSATKTKLQHCGSCKRISYCCKAHQIQDWTNHKKFCGVIKKVEEEIPKENLNEKMAWYYYRLLFHHKCKMGMQRVLKPYEVHMIFFPKRCEICGVINAHIICQTCLCVNYCSEEHRNADSSFHSEKCSDLKLCMNMHYLSEGYGGLDISQRRGTLKLHDNIKDFIASSITIKNKKDHDQMQIGEISMSAIFTHPLTLVNSLNLLNFKVKNKLVVHVVHCQYRETLNKWEVILQLFPQLQELTIFFIVPEEGEPISDDTIIDKQIYKYRCFRGLHPHFVMSAEYETPDIVLTSSSFRQMKISSSPLLEFLPLLYQKSPLILTTFSELEAKLDLEILTSFDSNLVVRTVKNSFASLWPWRCMVSSEVAYSNNYISLVTKN